MRAEFTEDTANTDSIQKTWKGKESESPLCLRPGVFIKNGAPGHLSSQTSGNKDEYFGVLCKSLIPWNQGSW